MASMRIRRSRSDAVFDTVNIFLLVILTLIMIYPIYFTVVASMSDPLETAKGRTFLFIRGFTLDAYRNVFKNSSIWRGYANSILYTVAGTLWALCVTIPCAYAMSRKYLKGVGVIMGIYVFTMYFGGGLIPTYMLMRKLNLVNNWLVLIIPSGFSVYNMIVSRTFYRNNFPDEIYEAAKIEGCSEFGIFIKIALPVSGAIIAVIALYNAVGHWNSYFSALLYLSDVKQWPLQMVLRSILIQNQQMTIDPKTLQTADLDQMTAMIRQARMAEAMKYSLIFISSLPMLIAYPFVQKYFVKGVLIGSIKG